MKICYFLMSYPGLHRHVAQDEITELLRRGHYIEVIAVWGGEKKLADSLPYKVIYLDEKIHWFNLLKLFFKYRVRTFIHLGELFKHLGKIDSLRFISQYPIMKIERFDRIHAHFASNNALRGYLAAKFYQKPFSCTAHASEILFYPLQNLKELILNSRPFITISQYNKKFLVEKYNIPDNEIVVNYCGIDTDFFRRKNVKEPETFTIISVAALKPVKGLRYLIKACSILLNKGINFKLKIAGHGPEHNKLQQIATELKVRERVKFLGVLNSTFLKRELENSTIFVLPSLSEGIPIALMEAMAMELPVIATNITGIPELIDDQINGLLVEKANSKDLAEKIELLYSRPDLRKKLANNARKKVVEKFNLKRNVSKLEKFFKDYS